MLTGLLAPLRESAPYSQLLEALVAHRRAWARGATGAEKAFLLATALTDPRLDAGAAAIVAPSQDAAQRLVDDVGLFAPALVDRMVLYPHWETMPYGRREVPLDAVAERRALLERLHQETRLVALLPAAAFVRRVLPPDRALAQRLRLHRGERLDREHFLEALERFGYERVGLVEARGQAAVRGGVIDVYPTGDGPYRIELFGDEVESIRVFDPSTQRSVQDAGEAILLPLRDDAAPAELTASWLDYLPADAVLVFDEEPELANQVRTLLEQHEHAPDGEVDLSYLTWEEMSAAAAGHRTLALSALRNAPEGYAEVLVRFGGMEAFGGQTNLLARSLREWRDEGRRIVIATAHPVRITEILADHDLTVRTTQDLGEAPSPGSIVAVEAPLSRGFTFEPATLAVLTDSEIFGWRRRRPRLRFLREGTRISTWADLESGDYVVHLHHGIGRYRGLIRLTMNAAARDYLLLEYAGHDRLYVPTDQIGLIQRYIGIEGQPPKIHSLGGAEWEREKQRVKEAARELAGELLTLYAIRHTTPGHAFAPDTPWQGELEAAFPFEETADQWQAIQDVKRDMEARKPMDRLIAGDVGYGKTEVALRAAFKAVMDGKQVGVLVPTTILAQQHYNVFLQRFAPYPIRVEVLSRFRSAREQRRILADLAAGKVDVIIGTHRLLGKDVGFKELGLVIIDEEQRFGVEHKEKLKQLRKHVDVLTLTATPIPRTLHMSLVGLRDMSVMETPPEARLPIHTEIREEDEAVIRDAILRELGRGGQVYVVHNRVQTIDRAARRIARLVPEARVVVAHGQMPEEKLERVMMDFLGGRFDVLVCTTIVEIGLDIPQVNTILIEDAHMMGLAQLYQLRGRVGRAEHQAYCYLLYPRGEQLTEEAEARLRAMQEFVELGSGFKLAMRDLEIRGAGNILGPEQHGQVAAVGFDLYLRLLDQAIRELRGEVVDETPDPTVDVNVDAHLAADYIPDEGQRMTLYRRLAGLRSLEEVDRMTEELRDRFGPPPRAVANLLDAVRLRILAKRVGAAAVGREGRSYAVRLRSGAFLSDPVQRRLRVAYGRRVHVTPALINIRTQQEAFAEQVSEVRDILDAVARFTRQREETLVKGASR